MIELPRPPGLPADFWIAPGTRAPEGHLARVNTIDPNDSNVLAQKALLEAAEAVQDAAARGKVDPGLIKQACRAYVMATDLPVTPEQLEAMANDKILETARAHMATIDGGSDRELLGALARGLTLMARACSARGDQWNARDFAVGRRLAAMVLGVYLALAKEQAAA